MEQDGGVCLNHGILSTLNVEQGAIITAKTVRQDIERAAPGVNG